MVFQMSTVCLLSLTVLTYVGHAPPEYAQSDPYVGKPGFINATQIQMAEDFEYVGAKGKRNKASRPWLVGVDAAVNVSGTSAQLQRRIETERR